MDNPIEYYRKDKTSATKSKHRLLQRYMRIWAGMVLNSRQPGDLVYLDTFAGTGIFPTSSDVSDDLLDKSGSPIIGLNVLNEVLKDKRFKQRDRKFHAILFETDQEVFNELRKNMSNSSFPDEMYTLINGDILDNFDLVQDCVRDSFVLAFIDPFNVGPLPFMKVRKLITTGRTDALIFFPADQILRYQGILKAQDFKAKNKLISHLDTFFGDTDWQEIVHDNQDGNDVLTSLTVYYMNKIAALGKHVTQFNFLFPKQNKILYKILLTTKSTEAILHAKELIAEIEEYQSYLRSLTGGQLVFDLEIKGRVEADIDRTAETLYKKFGGREVRGEDIYLWAVYEADSTVHKGTVRKAITIMKKKGQIEKSLKPNWNSWTKIKFN